LGEAILKSTWDPDDESFNILADIIYTGNIGKIKTLEVLGAYYPNRKENNYNIGFTLNNFKLNTLQPFLKSFSSQLQGSTIGLIMKLRNQQVHVWQNLVLGQSMLNE